MSVKRSVHSSGLRIVTEEVPSVRSAAVGIWVNVGSRDEAPATAGASHFLEHLLFKGTTSRTALDISSSIESVGGEMNAFTSKEYTCFYARVIDTDLPMAIDVVSDLITSSIVTALDVDAERKVVLEEIAMRDDDPSDLVHDLFSDTYYGDTQIGRPILGTVIPSRECLVILSLITIRRSICRRTLSWQLPETLSISAWLQWSSKLSQGITSLM